MPPNGTISVWSSTATSTALPSTDAAVIFNPPRRAATVLSSSLSMPVGERLVTVIRLSTRIRRSSNPSDSATS
jgi:hypothetical protein